MQNCSLPMAASCDRPKHLKKTLSDLPHDGHRRHETTTAFRLHHVCLTTLTTHRIDKGRILWPLMRKLSDFPRTQPPPLTNRLSPISASHQHGDLGVLMTSLLPCSDHVPSLTFPSLTCLSPRGPSGLRNCFQKGFMRSKGAAKAFWKIGS